MIKNQQQLRQTQNDLNRLKQLRRRVAQLVTTFFHNRKLGEIDSVSQKIEELEIEIESFNQIIVDARAQYSDFSDLSNLGKRLIAARVAAGYSQLQLARRCNLKQQQVSKYEVDLYQSATLARIMLIASVLHQALQSKAADDR